MKAKLTTTEKAPHVIDWFKVMGGLFGSDIEPYPPYEQEQLTKLLLNTTILMIATEGEDVDIAGKLDRFLHIVETPFGMNLALCASEARQCSPETWAAFSTSIRLPGNDLVPAVLAWLKAAPNFSHSELFYQRKSEGPLTKAEADYYDRAIRADIPPGLEALEAKVREWQRLDAAEKKRKQRVNSKRKKQADTSSKTDKFKEIIQRDWLTFALWCRTTKGILKCYPNDMPQEEAEQQFASFKRIDDVISKLGFSSSRKPDYNDIIEAAETSAKKQVPALR